MSNDSKNQLKGSKIDEILNGTAMSEKIDAKVGNDTSLGGAGNDWVKGGPGDDLLDGGVGNDTVDGGAGNDRLQYVVSDNTGAEDVYDGGSGTNTLILNMTRAEWMRDDIQADLAAFLQFLASEAPNANGQMSSKGFTFASLDLQVRRVSGVEVFVDGVAQDPRDENVIAVDDIAIAATEHSELSGNLAANDFIPDLMRTVELVDGPTEGNLLLDTDGTWHYDPGMAFDALAQGENTIVEFIYRISDADRDSDTATVTLTINGTNDTPVATDDTGSTDENEILQIAVLDNDTDVDASDTHTVTQASIVSGLGAVTIVDNSIRWAPGTDYDNLALGDTATVHVAYTIKDNHAATDEGVLAIKVAGSNDAPTVTAALSEAISEQDSVFVIDLLANATDVDQDAVLSVANFAENGNLGGWILEGNSLRFDPNHFDPLNTGDTATVNFTYQVRDEHGATADQQLSVAVAGYTDAPTLAVVAPTAGRLTG